MRKLYTCGLLWMMVTICALAADSANAVLERMDHAAAGFRGMTGDVTEVVYTAVISDTSSESGSVKLRKAGANRIEGLLEFTTPDHKFYLFKNRKIQIYTPSINAVQVVDLSHSSIRIEQFLLIGFGTPRKDLEADYQIVVKDHPALKGKPTTRIELTPRSAEVLKRITHLELWIPDGEGNPIQEKVYQLSGDTNTWTYSNVRINPTPVLTDADLKLNLPKGVQYLQK